MKDQCEYCMFYLPDEVEGEEASEYGICRRYPPRLVEEDDGFSSEYPPIKEDDWCGEHEPQLGRRDKLDGDE